MKTSLITGITVILSLIFILLSAGAVAAEDRAVYNGGTVTLPLQNFLDLTKKPHTPKPLQSHGETVPVRFIFTGGNYTVSATPYNARVEGVISMTIYQTGWVEVPLLRKGMAISSAQLDGKDLPLYVKDDSYHMLARGVGEHTLKLSFYVNTSSNSNTTTVTISTPQTTVTNVSASVPIIKAKVTLSPAIVKTTCEKDGKTFIEGSIPSGDGTITLSWTPRAVIPAIVKAARNQKPRIYGTIDTLLSVKQDALSATSTINYSILYNTVRQFTFAVPEDVNIINISGTHFLNWEKSEKGDLITAFLSQGVEGNYTLTVEYEKPIQKINSTWAVPVLHLIGVERTRGTIGCFSDDNIEIAMGGVQGAGRIDEKDLPLDIRNRANRPIMLAFKYQATDYQISLETKKLDEIPVLATTIDTARAITVVNDEGNAVTTLSYEMRNNEKQYLEINLPAHSRLLGAFVNNMAVKPVKGRDEGIKIPLLKSRDNGSPEAFTVEITYISAMGSFEGLTAKKILPPSSAVPISDFYWSLYLPKEQRVMKFGGSMKLITESKVTVACETPAKSPAAPACESKVMKITADEEICRAPKGRSECAVKAQKDFESATIARIDSMVTARTNGVNPVKISIPRSGNLYRFNKLLVIDRCPVIIAYCYQNWIFKSLLFVTFIIMTAAGLALVQRGITRKEAALALIFFVTLISVRTYIGEFFGCSMLSLAILFLYWLWNSHSGKIIDALKTAGHKPAASQIS